VTFDVDGFSVQLQYDSAKDKWSVVGGFYANHMTWVTVAGYGASIEEATKNYAQLRKQRIQAEVEH